MTLLIPVILSGGAGTRLWPLSREMYPKQLLALTGKHTMLQDTVTRLAGIAGAQPPLVVCNEAHRFTVAEQIRGLELTASAILRLANLVRTLKGQHAEAFSQVFDEPNVTMDIL